MGLCISKDFYVYLQIKVKQVHFIFRLYKYLLYIKLIVENTLTSSSKVNKLIFLILWQLIGKH